MGKKNVVSRICQDTCHHTQPPVSQNFLGTRLLPRFTWGELRHGAPCPRSKGRSVPGVLWLHTCSGLVQPSSLFICKFGGDWACFPYLPCVNAASPSCTAMAPLTPLVPREATHRLRENQRSQAEGRQVQAMSQVSSAPRCRPSSSVQLCKPTASHLGR